MSYKNEVKVKREGKSRNHEKRIISNKKHLWLSTNIIFICETMKVNDRIRQIRINKSLTQEYVAEKLGIDTVNYGRIERGQASLTVDRLMQLSEIMEFDIIEIFEPDFQNGNANHREMIGYLDKILNRVDRIYNLLEEKVKQSS